MGRIEHGFNVRPDLCAVDNDINPRKYLGKFWTDSLVHDAQALDLLVKVIGEVMSKTVKSSHSTVIAYHIPLIPHACSTDSQTRATHIGSTMTRHHVIGFDLAARQLA